MSLLERKYIPNPYCVVKLNVYLILFSIVQSIACLIAGSVLGLVFVWKLGLVAMACIPLVVSTGYIRLVRKLSIILSFVY